MHLISLALFYYLFCIHLWHIFSLSLQLFSFIWHILGITFLQVQKSLKLWVQLRPALIAGLGGSWSLIVCVALVAVVPITWLVQELLESLKGDWSELGELSGKPQAGSKHAWATWVRMDFISQNKNYIKKKKRNSGEHYGTGMRNILIFKNVIWVGKQ